MLTLATAACTDDAIDASRPTELSAVEYKDIPQDVYTKVDVLFVVESSPAMAAYQARLAEAARPIAQRFFEQGTIPDIHIGVISGDPAEGARLRRGRFLADESRFAWTRYRNYTGLLPDNFAALLDVGSSGPRNQPLISLALQALAPTTNPGFRRQDARLDVVFVTASDDHSDIAMADIRQQFRSPVTGYEPSIGIVGACGASDTPRLSSSSNGPYNLAFASLCEPGVPDIVDRLVPFSWSLLTAACVEGKLVQPHEIEAWLEEPTTGAQVDFPECRGLDDRQCWSLLEFPSECTVGDHLLVDIRRSDVTFPARAIFNLAVEPSSAPF